MSWVKTYVFRRIYGRNLLLSETLLNTWGEMDSFFSPVIGGEHQRLWYADRLNLTAVSESMQIALLQPIQKAISSSLKTFMLSTVS